MIYSLAYKREGEGERQVESQKLIASPFINFLNFETSFTWAFLFLVIADCVLFFYFVGLDRKFVVLSIIFYFSFKDFFLWELMMDGCIKNWGKNHSLCCRSWPGPTGWWRNNTSVEDAINNHIMQCHREKIWKYKNARCVLIHSATMIVHRLASDFVLEHFWTLLFTLASLSYHYTLPALYYATPHL